MASQQKKSKEDSEANFDSIIEGVTGISLEKAQSYAKRLGVTSESNAEGHAFVNGKHINMDGVSSLSCESTTQLFADNPRNPEFFAFHAR
jgi:hypothetical protein